MDRDCSVGARLMRGGRGRESVRERGRETSARRKVRMRVRPGREARGEGRGASDTRRAGGGGAWRMGRPSRGWRRARKARGRGLCVGGRAAPAQAQGPVVGRERHLRRPTEETGQASALDSRKQGGEMRRGRTTTLALRSRAGSAGRPGDGDDLEVAVDEREHDDGRELCKGSAYPSPGGRAVSSAQDGRGRGDGGSGPIWPRGR